MSYHASNPHYSRADFSDDRQRQENAEEVAGQYFADATKAQKAVYDQAMAALKGLEAPRYERARSRAQLVWKHTTRAARELCDETYREYLATGEVSEALSYRWDELAVAGAMLEAAE